MTGSDISELLFAQGIKERKITLKNVYHGFQDQLGGLEIQNLEGEWVPATPIPGTIVINIGDLLQYWSGNRYRATPHRVRCSTEEAGRISRFSVAVFVHPNHNTDISPIGMGDIEQDEDGAEEGREKRTAEEHVRRRFQETYRV